MTNEVKEIEEVVGQQTFEMGESEMEELYINEAGFIKRNKGAIGTATGVGVAGFVGGFLTGKITEKKKSEAIIKRIMTDIESFNTAIKNEGPIDNEFAFTNAQDIKNKIFERMEGTKMKEKEIDQWRTLLDELTTLVLIGENEERKRKRTTVGPEKEETH